MSVQTGTDGVDRVAANERLFLRLAGRSKPSYLSPGTPFADFACECQNHDCHYRVEMTVAQYEPLRASTSHFAVAPRSRHVDPTTERVVEWHQFYWVIERQPIVELIDFFRHARAERRHLALVPADTGGRPRLPVLNSSQGLSPASHSWGTTPS